MERRRTGSKKRSPDGFCIANKINHYCHVPNGGGGRMVFHFLYIYSIEVIFFILVIKLHLTYSISYKMLTQCSGPTICHLCVLQCYAVMLKLLIEQQLISG